MRLLLTGSFASMMTLVVHLGGCGQASDQTETNDAGEGADGPVDPSDGDATTSPRDDAAVSDAAEPPDTGGDATVAPDAGGGGTCGAWTIARDAKAPASASVAVKGGRLVFGAPAGKGSSYIMIRASQGVVTGDFDASVVVTDLSADVSNGAHFNLRKASLESVAGISVYPNTSTKHYVQIEGCPSAGGYVSNVGPLTLRLKRAGTQVHIEASANGDSFVRDCTVASAPAASPELSFGGFGSNDTAISVAFDDFSVLGAGGCADDFSAQNF